MPGHNGGYNPYRDANGRFASGGSGRPAYGKTTTGTRRILQAPSQAVYKQATKALTTFRKIDRSKNPSLARLDTAFASRQAAGRVLKRTKGETAQRLGSMLTQGDHAAGRWAASDAEKVVAAQARRKRPKG